MSYFVPIHALLDKTIKFQKKLTNGRFSVSITEILTL